MLQAAGLACETPTVAEILWANADAEFAGAIGFETERARSTARTSGYERLTEAEIGTTLDEADRIARGLLSALLASRARRSRPLQPSTLAKGGKVDAGRCEPAPAPYLAPSLNAVSLFPYRPLEAAPCGRRLCRPCREEGERPCETCGKLLPVQIGPRTQEGKILGVVVGAIVGTRRNAG